MPASGDCTWTGCVPSKSFLAAARSIHAAKQYGLVTRDNPKAANIPAIRAQLQANIQKIYDEDDAPEALAKLGIDVVQGKAVLQTDRSVRVLGDDNTFELTAREGIVLCTGASPAIPTATIEGLDDVDYWTYENVWKDLGDRLPERLAVIGGGPIGCELAQAFGRLGSRVTMIASSRGLLPREDPAVGRVMQQVFEQEGIQIVKGRATAVRKDGTVVCDNGQEIPSDRLLLATGRVPRCQGMNLEGVGIELTADKTAIQVDNKLQTTVKGIYAAGDCTGDRQFTHYAGYQGAIAARNILLPLSDPGVLETVPSTTFTSPEVASVGLSEAAAIEQYGADKIVVAEKQLSTVDRAVTDGTEAGFIKIVYLKRNGKVVGSTIVSPAAGELVSEMAVVIKTGLPFDQLATVMHCYPTYSFALQLMAADVYYEKTLKLQWLYDILKKLGL